MWLELLLTTPQGQFLFGFLQNFVADLIVGLGLGVFLTKWVETRDKAVERSRRKDQIIRLLLTELNDNLDQMTRNEERNRNEHHIVPFLPGLKNETWKAIAESGEVRWFDENLLVLLNNITVIYHYIGSIKQLEIEISSTLAQEGQMRSALLLRKSILDGYAILRKQINALLNHKVIIELANEH